MGTTSRRVRGAALVGVLAVVAVAALESVAPAALAAPAAAPSSSSPQTVTAVVVDGNGAQVISRTVPAAQAPQVVRQLDADPAVDSVAVSTPVALVGTVDPLRGNQWADDALGIDALPPTAPDGSHELVAVLDTGVLATHEDLAGRVRCDLGADFAADAATADPAGNGCVDPNGHGTHVAGEIAALGQNGIGVEGVSSASLMPVRVLAADGSGSSDSVARGVVYAVDHGANVINMSLAGAYNPVYDTVVQYAVSHGVVVVVAAGNDRATGDAINYPAASPGAISVAAVDQSGTSATFSYSGPTNFISAPGVSVLSTNAPSGYAYRSGTSMAAPIVAAVVARFLDAHAGVTVDQVRAALQATATDVETPGYDSDTGYGVINPAALLALGPVPAAPTAPAAPGSAVATVTGTDVHVTWGAAAGAGAYRVYRDGTLLTTVAAQSYLDRGAGRVHTWAVSSVAGGSESARTTATVVVPPPPAPVVTPAPVPAPVVRPAPAPAPVVAPPTTRVCTSKVVRVRGRRVVQVTCKTVVKKVAAPKKAVAKKAPAKKVVAKKVVTKKVVTKVAKRR